ncbi:MAG: hypothetical protein ACOZNI_29490 [Myxococcota bacterium]
MRTSLLLLLLSVTTVGCGSAATDDTSGGETDADTDADTDTDTDTDVPILEDGLYMATTNAIEDDTCGGLAEALSLAAANARVEFVTATTFDVGFPCCDVGYSCEVGAGGEVTCGGYDQEIPLDDTATLLFGISVVDFAATSLTSFDQVEEVGVDCSGDGCADAAAGYETTFPCSLRIDESFAQ